MNKKNTRRGLFYSVISLLLCVSMLVGTTLAWFSDSVSSTGNIIKTGSLDVTMEYASDLNGEWADASEATIFSGNLWEPGYSDMKFIKVSNDGNLAFSYQMNILPKTQAAADAANLADVIDVYVGEVDGDFTAPTAFAEEMEGLDKLGTMASIMGSDYKNMNGVLMAEEEVTYCVILHMQETAGNEYQDLTVGEDFTIQLVANQYSHEEDSFGSFYDDPNYLGNLSGTWTVSAPVVVAEGAVAEALTIGGEDDLFVAEVPVGVKVEEGVEELTLVISTQTTHEADVQLEAGQIGLSLDVHVEGVSADNTAPITIKLGKIAPTGLYEGNIVLYHVENGVTNRMTQVADMDVLDAHNEFYYNGQTGEVTIMMATFSEVYAAINYKNSWDGTSDAFDWYAQPVDNTYTLNTAADLFGFAKIVGGMADGIAADDFAGKTVKLGGSFDLGGNIWYPIGYNRIDNNDGTITTDLLPFKGTFDGNGHTIANFFQSTWEMKGDNTHYPLTEQRYDEGMGLFGLIDGGTVKNLVIDGMVAEGEFTDVGCVTAYARGNSTFDNIRISNASCYSYNCRTAGIVAYDWINESPSNFTFSNIEIDPTSTFGALWGSWDVACAGILGYMNDASTVTFENCEVGCELDVFNDVCANYQYYDYRYAGMLIGTVGRDGDTSDMPGEINFVGNKNAVYYGDWVNHYHCELVVNSEASYTHDYQMSRLDKIYSLDEIRDENGNWNQTGNFVLMSNMTCYHIVKDENGNLREYKHEEAGKETIEGNEVLVEDKQVVHTVFNQIYTGYGWGAVSVAENLNVHKTLYTITYVNDGKVLDVTYVTQNMLDDNGGKITIEHDATATIAQNAVAIMAKFGYTNLVFDHWMNAGSMKVDEITTTNQDYILYPSFVGVYTASFVNQQGDIIHYEFFKASKDTILNAPTLEGLHEDYELDYWGVVSVDSQGKITYTNIVGYDFSMVTSDITVYPVLKYNGDVKLIPVDSDGDGSTNYYQVGGYGEKTGKQELVEIPNSVNGIPVTEINADAFSSYDDLHSVVIPGGIKEINSQAFSADTPHIWSDPSTWGEQRDTITMYFEGNPATWNAAMEAYNNRNNNYDADGTALLKKNWDNMMGESSCVFFLVDGKVDLSKGYWELAKVNSGYVWQYHNHPYGSNGSCGNEHNNKTNYTAQCNCDIGKHDRPDAKYWN